VDSLPSGEPAEGMCHLVFEGASAKDVRAKRGRLKGNTMQGAIYLYTYVIYINVYIVVHMSIYVKIIELYHKSVLKSY